MRQLQPEYSLQRSQKTRVYLQAENRSLPNMPFLDPEVAVTEAQPADTPGDHMRVRRQNLICAKRAVPPQLTVPSKRRNLPCLQICCQAAGFSETQVLVLREDLLLQCLLCSH